MTAAASGGVSDQQARTLLAWRRTALSLAAAGVLAGHLTVDRAGRGAVTAALLCLGAIVVFAWLSPLRRPAAAGLSLVAGVAVLDGLLLRALVSG